MEYIFEIVETRLSLVKVEAESDIEAEDKVVTAYRDNEIDLSDGTILDKPEFNNITEYFNSLGTNYVPEHVIK